MWLACLPWRLCCVVGLPALEAAMVCGWSACPGGGHGMWLVCLPWRGPWYVVGLPALEEAMVCGRLAYPGGGGKLACLEVSYIYSLKKGDISLYLYIYIVR